MKFEEVLSHVEGIPHIKPKRAKILYDFILEKQPLECLEMGFSHGASSCYIAAALDEIGNGHLTSVDLYKSQQKQPNLEELLAKTGLQEYVTIEREATSYTWFLKKKIEANSIEDECQTIYDFCFIDGPKNWTIDGCAFFLADKLLNLDGWILFDDFSWTYAAKLASGKSVSDGITLRELGEDELSTPHVERIFRLLVMQHPNYSDFRIQDHTWAWAHKIASVTRQK